MIDSTPSGHVGHERAARSPELVVEPDACRQAEEALGDTLAQAGKGTSAVALQREQVLAGEEDRLDALSDRGQVRAAAGLITPGGSHDRGAQGIDRLGATIVRPTRRDEPGRSPHLAPIRQRIESIFFTCKDLLTLERHGARTLAGLRERVAQRFLCLAACVWLNHQLGRPSRSLVAYVA